MSISNFTNFKSELKDHLQSLKSEIKVLVYKEFRNYIFKTKLNAQQEFSKSFLTKAFCELATYCYLQNFNAKLFNSKNYSLIKDYLKNSEDQFINKDFKKVVIVSASKLSKDNAELNQFINTLTNKLKVNVSIRNLDWYNNEHFLREVKLDKKVSEYQEELFKMMKTYDKELFDLISEEKFRSTRLSFKEDWNVFLEKKVAYSLEKFIFTPINYDEDNYDKKMNKLSELVAHDTIFIFVNNIEVESKYKTTLLNDLSFFSDIIKFDSPIFTIDNNDFFSLLNPLSLSNFRNFHDLASFLIEKPARSNSKNLTVDNSKSDDTLNWYWNKILDDDNKQEEMKEILGEEKDLEKTVTFNDHSNLDEILKEHNSHELTKDFENLLAEITQEHKLLDLETSKKASKEFERFIALFDKEINSVELSSSDFDKDKYLYFRDAINQKNIEEVMDFLSNKIDSLTEMLQNKKMSKQDAMNYYTLYIKIKSCLNEIDFLRIK
ncbi:hypothetical protein [Spiroplasma monobiae]|uniref:Uncharacterized protein n=1 Tax=Spiroplasma monobiae MQ-1 TaxID=1336748 RepID=A0A2K9LUE7_SPISQ|nr:hypothetical protein [Spiroplasma monobiae]AUM62672.1 hypothetical protein SMONO_v1c04230 [Spiroplasma monobiae MQ-1]